MRSGGRELTKSRLANMVFWNGFMGLQDSIKSEKRCGRHFGLSALGNIPGCIREHEETTSGEERVRKPALSFEEHWHQNRLTGGAGSSRKYPRWVASIDEVETCPQKRQ